MVLANLLLLVIVCQKTTADTKRTKTPEVVPVIYQWPLGDNGTVQVKDEASCSGAKFVDGKVVYYRDLDIPHGVRLIPAPDAVEDACAVWLDYDYDNDRYYKYGTFIDLGNFDGTCVSDPGACILGGFTWSVWLKVPHRNDSEWPYYLIRSGKDDFGSSFSLWYTLEGYIFCSARNGTTRLVVGVNATVVIESSQSSTLRTPKWFHVACVFKFSNNQVTRVYIDGVERDPLQSFPNNFDYDLFEEDRYYTHSNNLLLWSMTYYWRYYLNDYSCGFSNLVVTDGVLHGNEIQRLYSCGSMDWNLRIRNIVQVPGIKVSHLQLQCSASAATGPSIDWRVYQPLCGVRRDIYNGSDAGAVHIENRNVSSCVQTSKLIISNYLERGYGGAVIVCSASVPGTSADASANFSIPEKKTEPSFKVSNSSGDNNASTFAPSPLGNYDRPSTAPWTTMATDDFITRLFESFHIVNSDEDICGGKRIYEKEDRVITVVALSAAEGDYDEVNAALDGQVYKAHIPGIGLSSNETIVAFLTIYKSLDNSSEIHLSGDSKNPARFGSRILGLDVTTPSGKTILDFLENPIKIVFPLSETPEDERPVCSFQSNGNIGWYTDGCHVVSVVGDDVTCSCNHLTHFAVLLQLQEVEEDDTSLLDLLTRIGLGLSIACLAVTLLVYAVCRLTSTRIVTHANLAFALMASHITFFFTDIQNPAGCTAVAILLHFFLLAAFTWMALEGVFLYIQSTPTFPWRIRLPVWLLLGWGIPATVVVISVAARFHSYTRTDSCWLSFDGGFVWAFLAPVILILSVNTVLIVRLVVIFFSLKSNKDKSETAKFKAGLRVVLVLEPLLGLPWILNLFYVSPSTIFFAYASVILNSLQGVFVFLSQCLFDQEVKQRFRAKASKVEAISIIPESTGVSSANKSDALENKSPPDK